MSHKEKRCPKAHVTKYPQPSRYPFRFCIGPMPAAMFLARLGFSAMIKIISFALLSNKIEMPQILYEQVHTELRHFICCRLV
jgi:hypothetical protein